MQWKTKKDTGREEFEQKEHVNLHQDILGSFFQLWHFLWWQGYSLIQAKVSVFTFFGPIHKWSEKNNTYLHFTPSHFSGASSAM